MKFEKLRKIPMKEFIGSLKKLVKPNYLQAMWPIAGVAIIFFALIAILGFYDTGILSSLTMTLMMVMYGMASPVAILLALLEVLIVAIIMVILYFFFAFFAVAVQYTYQDKMTHPEQPVSAGSVWMHYKHLRKNQIWRIILYIGWFIFLWSLPLNIIAGLVGSFTNNAIAAEIIRLLNEVVVLWKSIEYSQSYFLYREKQPQFLGQSMRYALTASRRFMSGRKWNYFGIVLVVDVLPMLIWTLIFGGLSYYGIYTATYVLTYVGIILLVLGLACYLPVIFATAALYYDKGRAGVEMDIMYKDTFKPVAELTGEAYIHEVYVPKKAKKQPSPAVGREKGSKHEAKKDE